HGSLSPGTLQAAQGMGGSELEGAGEIGIRLLLPAALGVPAAALDQGNRITASEFDRALQGGFRVGLRRGCRRFASRLGRLGPLGLEFAHVWGRRRPFDQGLGLEVVDAGQKISDAQAVVAAEQPRRIPNAAGPVEPQFAAVKPLASLLAVIKLV